MPQEDYQINDISQLSESNNISLLGENETIWETIEGEKYVHLLQVFFYDPNNKNLENAKYKHLKLSPGFIVEPDRGNWLKHFKQSLPKKYKILHYPYIYPYPYYYTYPDEFKYSRLNAETDLKEVILSNCNMHEIPKEDSYACNNPTSMNELNYYDGNIPLEIRLKENMLYNYPNTCIAIFGDKYTLDNLNKIKLKKFENIPDQAEEFKSLSADNICELQELILMKKEDKNQEINLSAFGCDKIGSHLLNFIKYINKNKNSKKEVIKGEYLLTIIQHKSAGRLLDLPGGCRDLGEDSYDTIIRELKEETGITKEEVNISEKFWNFNKKYRLYTALYQTEIEIEV